ncbi:MAG: hypothetical protein ACR2QR_13735 [Woeseiaceae bacterium]
MGQLLQELKRRNVVRVALAYAVSAWLLIQIAETIFPLFGFGDDPARVVVILLAIGFPLALVLSWIYEITPDGLKLERDIDRSQSITQHTGQRLDRAIIVVLSLSLVYFAFDKFVLDPGRDASLTESVTERVRDEMLIESFGNRSIAVLPFVNMSDDASNEYFSDGISEEVLNLLARVSQLRVISRSSAFSFKGRSVAIPDIAESLNVEHVLEGSVRKSGNTVRITAQLIQARTDTHLWSETYDRTLDDIFAIQDEIAATVVEKLKVTLLDDVPSAEARDPEAYALALQARYAAREQTEDGLSEAENLYKQALAIDPQYVAAWNALSAVYSNQVLTGLLDVDEGSALELNALENALALDPDSATAIDSLGWIADKQEGDIPKAAMYVSRALEQAPNDLDVLSSGARMLQNLGRLDEAIVVQTYVVARDPLSPVRHNNLGAYYFYNHQYPQTKASFLKILELSPEYLGGKYFLGLTELLMGNAEAALDLFEQEADDQWRIKGKALANHELGRSDASDLALAEMIEEWGQDWPGEVADVYAYRGESDDAFQWLAKELETPGGWGEGVLTPLLQNLHDDPRWAEFLEKLGLSDAQLAAIEFGVTLPEQ